MLYSLLKKGKEWVCIFFLVLLPYTFLHAQTSIPQVLNYVSGQSVSHKNAALGDTFSVSFHGGSVVGSQHLNAPINTSGDKAMAGFKYGLVFAPNAFDKDMFVSKGYYPDYVQLSWEIARYQSDVTAYKIYRRELGSAANLVQVANISKDATSWRDEYAEANVMYEYKLFADGLFPQQISYLNILNGIGFRLPSGKVSGRVTFQGGGAVQGVSLIAQTNDNFSGTSLLLNGTPSSYLAVSPPLNDVQFNFENQFSFQAWIKPTGTGTSTIFQKGAQYKITQTPGSVSFTAGTTTINVPFTQKVDTFFNITAVRSVDSLMLYVMYSNKIIYKNKIAFLGTTTPNDDEVLIGKNTSGGENYKGYIDEVRIWQKTLPESDILVNTFLFISGTETNLSGYYRMNEGVGDNFYDLSRKGFSFNEKHGFMLGATWSTTVPNVNQLAVKGVTDVNGNYLITGIPYSSDGSTYSIVPAFGIHSFDPTQRLMFVGPGSNVYSDVNFTDVASFLVQGEAFYEGTRFPVDGVQITIDGKLALSSSGTPITTDASGAFKVDVPIGKHQLQLVKYGHVFKGGGYFPSASTYYDFQQPVTIQTRFQDSTRIKVIGKVVGGPVQASKAEGMGKTLNNIGNSVIVLTTQKEWDLKNSTGDSIRKWDNGYYDHKTGYKKYGTTGYKIAELKPTQIEITPDPETGEYVAYLLPEKYIVKSIVAGNPTGAAPTFPKYTFGPSYLSTLDFSNAFTIKNATDSIVDVTDFTVNPSTKDTTYAKFIDSVNYQVIQDYILRLNPTVAITSPNKAIDRFWESQVTAQGGSVVPVVTGDSYGQWITPAPIFLQRSEYKTKVAVFEQYINVDKSNAMDKVPVIDGKVSIQNDLAVTTKVQNFALNSVGELDYTFSGGLPNTTTGGIGDFQKSMTVKVFTGKNGSIVSNWPSDGNGFKGYILGGMPTGNNFVTTGPNVVNMIIRDPHGSNSYAYYEAGTSSSTEISYEVENGEDVDSKITASMGQEVITFAGVGAGVIIETKSDYDLSVGIQQSTTWTDNNTSIVTTSNSKRWSTSSEPDFVGANGDVFIGNSTNIVYGKNVFVDVIPMSQCDATANCLDLGNGYNIGLYTGLRMNPQFSTAFQYSANHIENYLIPNLQDLRNIFLKKKSLSGEYVYVIQPTDADFGNSNDPKTMVRRTDGSGIDGESYKINFPGGAAAWMGKEYVDTVAWYNNQIKGWTDLLARNEKEKVDAERIANYSYDAGTVFESSTTVESFKSNSSTFEFTISPSVATQIGFDVAGLGMSVEITATYNHRETKNTTTNETTSQIFGYVLNDTDEGDYYSVDIKDAKTQTGPVFAVRGGQSQCPYVDVEITKYYQVGTQISAATMRREVPRISVASSIVNNVAAGKGANFALQLKNASETGDDAWFEVSIDEKSVSGANIQIDGVSIGNGRTFFVPGGGSITKTLTIRQAKDDVFTFENVGIILHSLCQFDPGDNWEDISDTVAVSAFFQPACSDIILSKPNDKWLVNTGDMQFDGTVVKTIPLNIGIEGYDLNHNSFQQIAVQYKASSSSTWITDMKYFVDKVDYDAASEPKTWINSEAKLNYTLETKSLQDRNYDVRLKTICVDGTENFSTIVSGIKDIKRPKVFGTPQPGDGILSPGDDIMVTFDEPIQAGLLTSFNFSVRGVLNGAEISHSSVLFFDGVDNYASIIEGVKLADKSFTVEFWTQRINNTAGVIYAQGDVEFGFNSSNNFYGKFGNQTITTSSSYTSADDWMHWAVSYDYVAKMVSFYMNDQIVPGGTTVSSVFSSIGKIFIGKSFTGNNNLSAYLHDLRVWESVRTQGSVVANMNVRMRGDEVGLSGYWPMDEAVGSIANDVSRSHNAVLNGASWSIFPKGYARTFNGSSDYLTIPSGNVVVTKEMDMTLEFWMKGGPQSNKTIFSNGRGDNTDSSPPFENIWTIGAGTDGKLYAKNNGISLAVSKDFFDNKWHHVALVVKRLSNTTLFVDGNQEAFTPSAVFGGFSGPQMTLAAQQFYSSGSYTYARNFNGSVDEFRFWNLAKTQKLIELDKNAKLKGNEIGLMSYYPFEQYDVNLIINPSLAIAVQGKSDVAMATGGASINTDIPNIKQARPVQNVAYDYVVNNDKIIINITEDPELVEKTVIEITVTDVQDLNQNRLASPITWTAYMKKNTVLWNESVINKNKKLYDKLSFQVEISNVGGTGQNYAISNIPSWLTIVNPNGTLLPDSKKLLTFIVNESVNIGKYEQSLYLSSDFGFKEALTLNLNVSAQPPKWIVDPSKFEYNMSIVGTLNINGIESTNDDDMIAAFVNGELRGVSNLNYIPQYDRYEFFLDVYSNSTDGEQIDFQVWNASLGQIHNNVSPTISFEKNTIVGSPSVPQDFIVTNYVRVGYFMNKGWNWLSFYVNSNQLISSLELLKDVSANNGDIIKADGRYDQFGTGIGWVGGITQQNNKSGTSGFNAQEGYKLKLAQADTFYVIGSKIKTSSISVPLNKGWSWVGYPAALNMDVNVALGNVNFETNDFIKGQNSFAVYDYYLGWIGSLKFMKPTLGYMMKTGSAHTLTYPNPELINGSNSRITSAVEEANAPWEINTQDYANSMSFIIKTNLCTETIDVEKDYLGVFVDDVCRGFVNPTYISTKNEYVFFLTSYSNTSGEKMKFKFYDASLDRVFAIQEDAVFSSDAIEGTLSSPYILTVAEQRNCISTNVLNNTKHTDINIYPNPFESATTIEVVGLANEPTIITISDISGKVVKTLNSNSNKLLWDGLSDAGNEVSDGIYILTIHVKDQIINTKLIKK